MLSTGGSRGTSTGIFDVPLLKRGRDLTLLES